MCIEAIEVRLRSRAEETGTLVPLVTERQITEDDSIRFYVTESVLLTRT